MKRLSILCLVCALFVFSLTECNKKDDVNPQPPTDSTTTGGGTQTGYNQNDTTVNLQNGRFTLSIPAGAMKKGTKISIGNSNVAFVDTANLMYQFELKPTGTTFKKPVTLTVHYDSAWLKGHSPWDIGIAYKDDHNGKWYATVNGTVDTVKHIISIKTKHFSHWSIFTCFHLYMQYGGQLSKDNSRVITMDLGRTAYLLVNMIAPPAWRSDPDKLKHFTSHSLVAYLVPQKIEPKDDYQKAIKPDLWMVDNMVNGNEKVGTISFVGGVSHKLYAYHAPQEAPPGNDAGIIAQVNFKRSHLGHHNLWLLQAVSFKGGAWKLSFYSKGVVSSGLWSWTQTYKNAVYFHIDKNSNIVYDKNTYEPVSVTNLAINDPCLKVTSYSVNNFYVKISGITGKLDPETGLLHSTLNYTGHDGVMKLSTVDVCDGTPGDGYSLPVSDAHDKKSQMILPLADGLTKDTTFQINIGPVSLKDTIKYKLENIK